MTVCPPQRSCSASDHRSSASSSTTSTVRRGSAVIGVFIAVAGTTQEESRHTSSRSVIKTHSTQAGNFCRGKLHLHAFARRVPQPEAKAKLRQSFPSWSKTVALTQEPWDGRRVR